MVRPSKVLSAAGSAWVWGVVLSAGLFFLDRQRHAQWMDKAGQVTDRVGAAASSAAGALPPVPSIPGVPSLPTMPAIPGMPQTMAAAPSVSATPTPAPSAAVPLGASVARESFRVDMIPADCKAGRVCTVAIRLEATGDFHVNDSYPYKFRASEVRGVELLGKDAGGKNVFSKAAGDYDKRAPNVATLTVRFKPTVPGPVTIGGAFSMSVCSSENCQLDKVSLAVAVPVS